MGLASFQRARREAEEKKPQVEVVENEGDIEASPIENEAELDQDVEAVEAVEDPKEEVKKKAK